MRAAHASRMSSRRGTIEAMHTLDERVSPPGQDELPSEDGQPMDTPRHRKQMNLLIETLEAAWDERHDFYVGGNMFVYFSELQTKGQDFRGPDVFVVLDTDRDRERKSWVAWEERGQLPDVVIELLSESTEAVDRGQKKRTYERVWRTGHYFLYDPQTHTLEGFEHVRGRYVAITPDARGDLPVASMGLALGVRPGVYSTEDGPWLRWIDGESGALPTATERADAERARADAERTRADAERTRADAERARADAACGRVEELEAALRVRR